MGHRIELGEIEIIINMLDKVQSAYCHLMIKRKNSAVYTGDVSKADASVYLRKNYHVIWFQIQLSN